ncbi:hypothetical protein CQW23_07435 [Capsicum baccatum]|uniref:Pentatricopeptide repeat-containing protein n=1 Tax=Capsicum baccatum TaxID=33114 RepID=A0A2G2X689_CAPBA|nr:hypothetical protein CQW23_07435 [Capsicum baccatum]
MTKHRLHNRLCFDFSRTKRQPFTTSPLPAEATPTSCVPTYLINHRTLCFSLAENLILRGLFDSAQKVIRRIINQSSSLSEALSAVEFSISRGVEPAETSYGFLIRQLVTSGETQKAEVVYEDCILKRGIELNHSLLNSMVICYCNLGKLDEAKLLFEKLLDLKLVPCSRSCNELIKRFCGVDRFLDGFDVFVDADNADVLLSFGCYSKLVDGLCFRGYISDALYVLDVLCDRGLPPTVHLFKILVVSLCKRGRVEEAHLLSMEMESYGFVLDKVMYTTLINGYSKIQKMTTAMMVFFRMMKLGCGPDMYTYNTLINGFMNLGMFDKGWVLHEQMVQFGLEPDAVSYQIMIVNYCKYHKVDCALTLLDGIIQCNVAPSVHSYTALISALYKENRLTEVDDIYRKMMCTGLVPDHVLFFTLISNYPRGSEISLACTFLRAIAKNGCGIDLSYIPSPTSRKVTTDIMLDIDLLLGEIRARNLTLAGVAFNIYMIALCLGGKLGYAQLCMDKMASLSLQPSLSAYNSMIKCLFQKGLHEDAKFLVEVMQDQGQVPNQATFLIMVNEYCKQGDIQSAVEVLDQMEESGLKPSIAIYDSIIGCLGRKKRIDEALGIFRRMLEAGIYPDETMFVTMINALSRNGQAILAHELFVKMLEDGVQPSRYAYTALISGLVKKNMIAKGCVYLNRMIEEGFMPNTVLYTSLIKQFLRKREFEFAFKLVDLMERSEIERDLVTYITLVSGVSRNIRSLDGKWLVPQRRYEESKEMLFRLLHQSAMLPKEKCLKISVSSHEQIKFLALRLINKVKSIPLVPNLYLYNGIISGFCWAESMEDAYKHLDAMQNEGIQPNQVTFTILIDGHFRSGEIDRAVGLFNKMNSQGCLPDNIVYNTLIRGLCKHGRLMDALSLLYTMLKKGLAPSKASYESLLSSLCANNWSVHALKICHDMLANKYVPCRYNLKSLICILDEENKCQEAHFMYDLLLKKKRFMLNTS